ncbi:putative helicase mov-10-B.2 [Bacillus rossius redtenbacheri]|uniref:putative helicase mov-10-B.2 n=1 Tax=Bacillus rossius redtenbacheri TaxID=93214 RepID=UPI002FDE785B
MGRAKKNRNLENAIMKRHKQNSNTKTTTYCPLCGYKAEDSLDFTDHCNSSTHVYNYMLDQYHQRRNELAPDRHKVVVKIACDTYNIEIQKDGAYKINIGGDIDEVEYTVEILNKDPDRPVMLCKAVLLSPYEAFSICDKLNVSKCEAIAKLLSNSTYAVKVKFTNCGIGLYTVPVALMFAKINKQDEEKDFLIVRNLAISVLELEVKETVQTEASPFTGEFWRGMTETVFGSMPDGRQLRRLRDFMVPNDINVIMDRNLKPWSDMTEEDSKTLFIVLEYLMAGYQLTVDEYTSFFHTLMYMDEHDATKKLQQYNMANVSMKVVNEYRLELKVPGLAEKRPSVLKGDKILIRECFEDDLVSKVQYEAYVAEVHDECVWLAGIDDEMFTRIKNNEDMKFDIRFEFNRFPIFLMHRATELIEKENFMAVLFPEASELIGPRKIDVENLEFFNNQVMYNSEQSTAVKNILKGTSRPAPYIIFGPPGTGKTVTVVEAILQVKKHLKSYILVCAPSNAACDYLTQKLISNGCKKNELLRLHSSSREWSGVPQDIHDYSNWDGEAYFMPAKDWLYSYRIIVCTLISAGRLVPQAPRNTLDEELYQKTYHFTHVFIDECCQAQEPECLVAIGGILQPPGDQSCPGGQLILAGDPKQLGPICSTSYVQYTLGTSLMERLMKFDLYASRNGQYDSLYITMLRLNFRSHPDILELPNELFYENGLISRCGPDVLEDPLVRTFLLSPKKQGSAIIFHGVLGQEQREGRSPSHFNMHEVSAVLWYMDYLLGAKARTPVKQSDIGIIAPYIRQVYKLKNALKDKSWEEVEIGTTETFQGREKRVIIISTVRSNANLLDYDRKFCLGFLTNEKRFNVAITRARSLLIVVGNPHLLDKDYNWRRLILLARDVHGSYRGCAYSPLDDSWKQEVSSRFSRVGLV